MPRMPAAAVAGLLCLATACGSTVASPGGPAPAALQGAGSQGLGAAVPGTASGGSAVTNGLPGGSFAGNAPQSGTANGQLPRADGSAAGARSTGANGTGGAAIHSSGTGPLVPSVFKIGIQYSGNANAAFAAVGGTAFNDDRRTENNAVIAWINKHGGIAGRPAAPVYNNADATASPQAETEAACAQWTQDNHVSIAIPRIAVEDQDLMRECLKKASVPAMLGYVASRTLRSGFTRTPLWFENLTLSVNDYAQTYVQGLAAQGFFKGAKVGVVYFNGPPFSTALNSDLLPALKSVGVSNPETFGASISGGSDLSSGSQQMSNAVLAFRAKGVDHVLFFEPWVGYFTFLQNAKTQNYYPTYGLTSQQGPQLAMDLGLVPPDQLKNARLVSWNPITDTRQFQKYTGPRLAVCAQIYKNAGVVINTDQTSYEGQMADCENLLLIQDAYRNAPRMLSPQDFGTGIVALGARLQLSTRLNSAFTADKHWGTTKYWAGVFDSAASTFVLTGAPQDVK